MSDTRCPVCDDDGWIDVLDDDGFPVGARNCPRLDDPGHVAFNASGLIPEVPSAAAADFIESRFLSPDSPEGNA